MTMNMKSGAAARMSLDRSIRLAGVALLALMLLCGGILSVQLLIVMAVLHLDHEDAQAPPLAARAVGIPRAVRGTPTCSTQSTPELCAAPAPGSPSSPSSLRCIDLKTGKLQWELNG
jgi:hypothetical protein